MSDGVLKPIDGGVEQTMDADKTVLLSPENW